MSEYLIRILLTKLERLQEENERNHKGKVLSVSEEIKLILNEELKKEKQITDMVNSRQEEPEEVLLQKVSDEDEEAWLNREH